MNRRYFLGTAATTALSVSLAQTEPKPPATSRVTVAIIGTGGRGSSLARTYAKQPGVNLAAVCDVDSDRLASVARSVGNNNGHAIRTVRDFRQILEMKDLDAVVIATCNHWHAPMAILACCHGKHVYVEKPCSHNPWEGEMLVKAARKYQRHVQMGNQRRSWPRIIEAVQRVREGVLGRAYFAQSWYTNNRPPIGC